MKTRTSISCCHECPDRVVGCHGKCEKYHAAKAKADEEKDRIWAAKKAEMLIDAAHNEAVKITKKRMHIV